MNMEEYFLRLRAIADYQFGRGAGDCLFEDGDKVILSKRTKRIKMVLNSNGNIVVAFRPKDGYLTLGIEGAKRLLTKFKDLALKVVANEEAEPFIKKGRDLFAKHVIEASSEIRPGDEVIVVNRFGELLGVGTAMLNGEEMLSFRRGVAVKIRKGVSQGV
ncbi:MAG: pseudouridine synthase [Candidatus Methanomethylicota archaeon]|uniref:Pseudouridine synthase n=1 Tax=Thermoproteota archaeon TaxID=2056631 RepID=A0A497ETK1_9CREN|nr:MAG: pseudouridine synthase [Candidatus Verstraetearchaeota archaeon]RLE50704.1 MAG: pseudouridine synthase [Candidatus Verstraetearchaeota archaeon]